MKVVGAGLGRTGTYSLKLGLERLLGGKCYHMAEVFEKLDRDVPVWHAAARGEPVDWRYLFDGYHAAVDWPVASFWRENMEAFPDALVLLSVRDFDSWFESTQATIFTLGVTDDVPPHMQPWLAMMKDVLGSRFTDSLHDRDACRAAFDLHHAEVRSAVPSDRLLEWHARDGWAPLCQALGVEVPDEPFPKANTREEFIARRLVESATDHEGAELL